MANRHESEAETGAVQAVEVARAAWSTPAVIVSQLRNANVSNSGGVDVTESGTPLGS
jgi:hypothetical protein